MTYDEFIAQQQQAMDEEHYNADGGDAKVIYLPDMGIHGNSHFMFQELNNAQIATSSLSGLNNIIYKNE